MAKEEAKERELREALKLTVRTEQDAIKQNKALRKERTNLDKTTKQGIARAKEINKQIEENIALQRKEIDSDNKRTFNIGNYKSALEGLPDILQGANGGFKNMAGGIDGVTKASMKFILTPPIGAIIAAIVVAVSAVSAAFAKFQPLQDKLAQGTAAFSAGLEVLITHLAKIGKVIVGGAVLAFLNLQKGILKARIAIADFLGNDEQVKKFGDKLVQVNNDIAESQQQLKKRMWMPPVNHGVTFMKI